MAGRAATAVAGAWSAIKADLRDAFWVAANAWQIAATLQAMFEMQIRGGTVVRVPASDPMICTLIQLDGDMVTSVKPGVFESHSRDELDRLIEQHQAALEARLPNLGPGFAESLAGFLRSLRLIGWLAPLVTFIINVAAAGAQLLRAQLLEALWSLWPFFLMSFASLAIRLAAPPLLRKALSHGMLHLRPGRVPGSP